MVSLLGGFVWDAGTFEPGEKNKPWLWPWENYHHYFTQGTLSTFQHPQCLEQDPRDVLPQQKRMNNIKSEIHQGKQQDEICYLQSQVVCFGDAGRRELHACHMDSCLSNLEPHLT